MKIQNGFFYTVVLVVSLAATTAQAESAAYHNPAQILQAIHKQGEVGKGIYQAFCGVCHDPDPVINVGAPRKGMKQDWTSRLKQHNAAGMVKHIDEGLNNMPPRGGCFECSDADLLAAINYMLPKHPP